jgi:hypothetical protein
MYKRCEAVSLVSFLKKSTSIIPVGRVKLRKPLGHSGQRRLQEVVGSMDKLIGNADNVLLPVIREM